MDKELIRAEIDKRYAEYREKMKTDDFTYYEGMADALDLFEQFLDTLEPVSEDLEEEVKRYLCEECSGDDEPTVSEIARHFAEWQKAKMMEEATYNELMEQYVAIRDELVKRHRDVPVNIKEKL